MTVRGGGEVFVIDTSSIIEVRRLMSQEPTSAVTAVYARLIAMTKSGTLRFPTAVIEEIKAGAPGVPRGPDQVLNWAQACDSDATPHHEIFEQTRAVLDEVPDLLDVNKPSTSDEADPYVIGLAIKLVADGVMATVMTDDRKDSPVKTSMSSACGVMRLPSISMRVFLTRQRLWPLR